MLMGVDSRDMYMGMAVLLCDGRCVDMLMVCIVMAMPVFVFQFFMSMPVNVAFRRCEVGTQGHNNQGNPKGLG